MSGCDSSVENLPAFCTSPWCYVDAEKCLMNQLKCEEGEEHVGSFASCRSHNMEPSMVLNSTKQVYYSYSTCAVGFSDKKYAAFLLQLQSLPGMGRGPSLKVFSHCKGSTETYTIDMNATTIVAQWVTIRLDNTSVLSVTFSNSRSQGLIESDASFSTSNQTNHNSASQPSFRFEIFGWRSTQLQGVLIQTMGLEHVKSNWSVSANNTAFSNGSNASMIPCIQVLM